ncbi:hypothetical protein [Vibrio nigripulchritudo]|uniref:hypothetical protein n=1 Tax=Vibrio nigripulchritudo TaxID=28173 RepID=UPI0024904298|nr:hypothetical protein [Vibrio nigripulchritudo]
MTRTILLSCILSALASTQTMASTSQYSSECHPEILEQADITNEDAAQFTVDKEGHTAEVAGVICDGTLIAAFDMLDNHPNLKKIVFLDVGGSVDDETNLKLATLFHSKKLHTHVSSKWNQTDEFGEVIKGGVASGGTDLFLSGHKRTVDKGAYLGVHSWSNDEYEGADLPKTHSEHKPYIRFYKLIGLPLPEDFYFFTLEAATAEDMHYMTQDELETYQVITE